MFVCIDCKKSFDSYNRLQGHLGRCELHLNKIKSLYDKHLNEKFLRWWFEKKHETSNHLASIFNSKYPDYKIRA